MTEYGLPDELLEDEEAEMTPEEFEVLETADWDTDRELDRIAQNVDEVRVEPDLWHKSMIASQWITRRTNNKEE